MNRITTIRAAAALAIFIALAPSLRAAESTVWVEFENGKRLFREKEFGQALNAFRAAADERRKRFEAASKGLAAALKTPQAQEANGSILSLIDKFATDNFLKSELDKINTQAGTSLLKKIDLFREHRLADNFRGFLDSLYLTLEYRSFDELNDSIENLSKAIASLTTYPEAEYWIGRVFQAEGELKLAAVQYQRAWDMREAYEIADDRYTSIYALADLYRTLADYPRMEEEYLIVVQDDPVASDPKNEYLRNAMVNTLTKDGFDKFMSLYRTRSDFSVGAYNALGSFWYESGRQGKAFLYLGLATNRILTKAIESIRAQEPSYSYTDLADLLENISERSDLAAYALDSELYRLLFTLADSLYANGARQAALQMWRAVSRRPEAGLWATRSLAQLKSPVVKTPTIR